MIAQAIDQHGRKLGIAKETFDEAERLNAERINKVLIDMLHSPAPTLETFPNPFDISPGY